MKPVKQTIRRDSKNGVWGNCYQAVIASMLELPLNEVPHFADGGPSGGEFSERVRAFLAKRGLAAVQIPYRGSPVFDVLRTIDFASHGDVFYILGATSARGAPHAVIAKGGRIVFDPYPDADPDDRAMEPDPDGFLWVTFLVPTAGLDSGQS